jgi:multiple sugar transport system permease protein
MIFNDNMTENIQKLSVGNSRQKNSIYWHDIKKLLFTPVVWIILLVSLFPIYWTVSSSFKESYMVHSVPPKFVFTPTLHAYIYVWTNTQVPKCILNSFIIGVVTVGLALIFGIPIAYALNRYTFKRKKDISFWIISLRMAPPVVSIIPFFILIRQIGLYDTKISLIIIYLTFTIPFVVWMIRGYISQVPSEMDDAALIDGCSRLQILLRIILPVIKPGVLSTAIMGFIFCWNEFFFAFLLTGNNAKTVPVALNGFITMTGMRWDELTAAGTLVALPILIMSLLCGKHFISGLLEGALKD